MNNNQNQPPTISRIIPPPFANQQQALQIENVSLKTQVQKLQDQLKDANVKNTQLQHQNQELQSTNQSLLTQLNQKNQNSIINQLQFTLYFNRNSNENQILKDKCIELQLHNQDLLQKITQLSKEKQEKQFVEIKVVITPKSKSYLQYSPKVQEETICLKWTQKIANLQIKYKSKGKAVEFEGYGEIQNKNVIFQCQCDLSKMPVDNQEPRIILKECELHLIYQI